MTKLDLFELEKVTGGESDEQYTYYWDTVIALSKMVGKTLEEFLSFTGLYEDIGQIHTVQRCLNTRQKRIRK